MIQRDIARWRTRCRPALAVDFHAPGACESDGAYAYLPKPDQFPQQHEATRGWTDAIEASLTPEYASEKFGRVVNYATLQPIPGAVVLILKPGVSAFKISSAKLRLQLASGGITNASGFFRTKAIRQGGNHGIVVAARGYVPLRINNAVKLMRGTPPLLNLGLIKLKWKGVRHRPRRLPQWQQVY